MAISKTPESALKASPAGTKNEKPAVEHRAGSTYDCPACREDARAARNGGSDVRQR